MTLLGLTDENENSENPLSLVFLETSPKLTRPLPPTKKHFPDNPKTIQFTKRTMPQIINMSGGAYPLTPPPNCTLAKLTKFKRKMYHPALLKIHPICEKNSNLLEKKQ